MIKVGSNVKVTDNTGAVSAFIIGTYGGTKRKHVGLADVVKVTVKVAKPNGTAKKGQLYRAVIVRTKKEKRRDDGTYIRFDDNAVVLLNGNTRDPLGTRIFGPVCRELKVHAFDKITYLALETL